MERNGYLNQEIVERALKQFDEEGKTHTFSKEYRTRKKRLLRDYRKQTYVGNTHRYARVAAAAAVLLIAAPLAVNAATKGVLFNRIWGNGGRSNISAHDTVLQDQEKGTSTKITYPQREYTEIDAEKAKTLIGESVYSQPIVTQIGDVTMTVLSAVGDDKAAVVEFTLEQEGGIEGFEYSQEDNESKGAWFNDKTKFYFEFEDFSGSIYVDLDRSTKDRIHCYSYMTKMDTYVGDAIRLRTYAYPVERGVLYNSGAEQEAAYEAQIQEKLVLIPIPSKVASATYASDQSGSLTISPLSMQINIKAGLGLTEQEQNDSGLSIYYVAVQYKDGTTYTVLEQEYESHERAGVSHACETPIDNTAYSMTGYGEYLIVFNRLVDLDAISSITVNETTYAVDHSGTQK